ncbi:MAG TPA: peptidyl-prolyl cis-trans isomerase [Pyrinomonadaceae bacterium]|nr:peptidyl-prolyl cis-trans isomerase [Pyrinomonadaceae bacterium]
MKQFGSVFFFLALLFTSGLTVSAQETQDRVIDEVVAQVNDGVITLSTINREVKAIVEAETTKGTKREDVMKMVEDKKGEMIANLIHEELLMQKAKELGYEADVEASVNRRFLEIMKQYNMKTLDALYQEMEKSGANPQEIRDIWKKQATRDIILQKEVQGKIYWGLTAKELKDYYDKHRDKFTKAETVTVSEIFLGFAGRDENTVREKAKQIVAELKAGGAWDTISKENSDPPQLTVGGNKIKVADITEYIQSALRDLKVGGITNPIQGGDLGMMILRVDAREQASSESVFDDNAVRVALTMERAPEEQKKFFAELRNDSYIKINDNYRPMVSPLLFAEDRKEKAEAKESSKDEVKKSGKDEGKKSPSKEEGKKTASKTPAKEQDKTKEKAKENR